ncbi:hypothetical protein PIROE2DRAFT_59241 [Piromyces sp. E2]|nr:hypothetical protein PIROE2DRAFT_59241 [Piromyces sp. E2]|eukprot:OUM66651.1 hypothetical protein PIROE2DRAFT_59241 [Piromyces sp. E2]
MVQFSNFENKEDGGALSSTHDMNVVLYNYFDKSNTKFLGQLKTSENKINNEFLKIDKNSKLNEEEKNIQKYHKVNDEFEIIKEFCNEKFKEDKNKINEAFLKVMFSKSKELRDKITVKEKENKELQNKVEKLLHAAPKTLESLKSYEQDIKRTEEDIRKNQQLTEYFEVPELFKEKQVNRMINRFSHELNSIKCEIRESRNDLEETLINAFNKTKKEYERNITNLMDNMEDRYEDVLYSIENQYHDRLNNLEQAYERQKVVLNTKIEELMKLNLELEKKKELDRLINNILLSNASNPLLKNYSLIKNTAQEIKDIADLEKRRERMEELYNIFKLFSNLYGRQDLGVNVTPSILGTVKRWLDQTSRDTILAHYGLTNSFKNNKVKGYYNEEGGRDCPNHRDHSINGKTLGNNLMNIMERMKSASSTNNQISSDIQNILNSTSAADNNVQIIWNHPPFWGHCTNHLRYFHNGQQLGRFFHEYGGGFWIEKDGFIGNLRGRKWVPWESGITMTLILFKII